MLNVLIAVIKKDLKQYFFDRKAVLISLLVPLGIAFFFAVINGSRSSDGKPVSKIKVLVAEQAPGEAATMVERWKKDASFEIEIATEAEVEKAVNAGKAPIGIIIPKGFISSAAEAFNNTNAKRPELTFVTDPSKSLEAGIAKGQLMGGVMSAVAEAKYGKDFAPSGPDSLPFTSKDTTKSQAAKQKEADEKAANIAHIFCGMAVQGILFGAIESAMALMRDRQKGLLKRLTSAPVSTNWFLLGRVASSTIKAFFVLTVVLLVGMLVFKFSVNGSWLGLAVTMFFIALVSASFGLFVSALGKTEAQSRGLSTLAVLAMSMLGGAWFPAFLFPQWVQVISKFIPVRWAVDGLEAMTWRGQGFTELLPILGVLSLFAIGFTFFGLKRFDWTYEETK